MIRNIFHRGVLPLLSLLAVATSCSTASEKQPTVVSGHIANPLDSVVTFTRYRSLVDYAEDTIRLRLDAHGRFTLQLDTLRRAGAWGLTHGEHYFQLFLEPHDSLRLTLDGRQPEQTLRYSGRGSGVNNYFAELDRRQLLSFYDGPLYAGIAHVDTLIRRVDAFRRRREEVLAAARESLSPAARRYVRFAAEYAWADALISVPELYFFENRKPMPGLSARYYDRLRQLPVPQDSALDVSEYASLLLPYIRSRVQEQRPAMLHPGMKAADSVYSEAATKFLGHSRSRDYALARQLYEKLAFESKSNAAALLANFNRLNRDSALARIIRTEYANRMKLAPGHAAPEFALADSSGRLVSLSSFRGKAVYLDLWATWCGPCIQEMRAAPALYKAFAGRDVVFVAVSLDNDERAWRRWLRQHAAPGVVYLHAKGMNAPVAQAYQVKGIPSYWLIGSNGRIADDNPPRPSQLQEAQKAIEAVLPTRTAVARR